MSSTHYDFHWVEWFWTLAIGLPILAVVVRITWKRAKYSILWRAPICFVLALVITPWFLIDEGGTTTLVDVSPAISIYFLIDFGAGVRTGIRHSAEGILYANCLHLIGFAVLFAGTFIFTVIYRTIKVPQLVNGPAPSEHPPG